MALRVAGSNPVAHPKQLLAGQRLGVFDLQNIIPKLSPKCFSYIFVEAYTAKKFVEFLNVDFDKGLLRGPTLVQ